MKVLFIGGTGNISSAVARLAVERGIELTLLTRGVRGEAIPGAEMLKASIADETSARAAIQGRSFDVVVDWVAFTPPDVERDVRLFRGRTAQYVLISSASCYQKPPENYLITERTPLANPYSEYAQQKIACEERLSRKQEKGFPVTIVRPSLTYGDSFVPLPANSAYPYSYSIVDRMRRGKKVVVPGDGTSLWVLTHNSDFARGLLGLLGNASALGEAYHITSDEVLTWNQIYSTVADAAGVEPRLVHIASDFITACMPDKLGTLTGDKSNSVVFDNSKIKATVPEFSATMKFADGVRSTLAWFDAHESRRLVDADMDANWDAMIEAYEAGLESAKSALERLRETD